MARSLTSERLAELRVRVNACFEAGALATGASARIEEIGSAFSHMESDPDILAHYRVAAEALGRSFTLDDEGVDATRDLDGHGQRLAGRALPSIRCS